MRIVVGEPISVIVPRSRFALLVGPRELDFLEDAVLVASRSDDLDSETAAFVTELLEKIVEVRG